jgi:ribosomal protein L37E
MPYDPDVHLRAHEQLRLRFASLRRDPLFPALVGAWGSAWERDDDDACMEIERALHAALRSYGQPRPSGICAHCGYPKPEVQRDYEETCDACTQEEAAERRWKLESDARWARMTDEERTEHMRMNQFCLHGIITRNVQ